MIFKDANWNWQRDFSVPNLMGVEVFLMKINGQWPIDFKNYLPNFLSFLATPLKLFYFAFWSFMVLHIAILYAITMVIKLRNDESTIAEISTVFIQTVIYAFASYATIHSQWHHEKFAEIFDFMIENFKMRSARGLTYVTTEPCYRISNSFSLAYTVACVAGVLHFILTPIYLQVWELPLTCWYPFEHQQRSVFVLVYITQCLGQVQVGLAFGNADIIIATVVQLILGQYDILFCSLKNVRHTAMMLNGLTKNRAKLKGAQGKIAQDDEERNQYYYSYEQYEDLDDVESLALALKAMKTQLTTYRSNFKSTDKFLSEHEHELAIALRECIMHHQKLVNVCSMFESLYNEIVLVKSLQVTLQICNLAFAATKTTSSLLQIINYLEYLLLTLFDVIIFGYSGNWIKEQSIRVGDAALRCSWYLCGGRFRRDLAIVLTNTIRPVQLTGGKFFILDYPKVIGIVKASFSFYTLLQNLG